MMANLTNVTTPKQIHNLLLQPAGKPPAGAISNLLDPPDLDGPLILATILFLSVSTLAIGLRVYTKVALLKSLAYEDCKS